MKIKIMFIFAALLVSNMNFYNFKSISGSSKFSASIDSGINTSILETQNAQLLEHSTSGIIKAVDNQTEINKTGIWGATDYEEGEIIMEKYTIQLGDTLWEIAEGYYGSGEKWIEILSKNINIISFQENGEQSLIFPGQIIEL